MLHHRHYGGTGKAVERVVQQYKGLAVRDLFVHNPGSIGARRAGYVPSSFNADPRFLQLFPERSHQPLSLLPQRSGIKGLLRFPHGNPHARAQIQEFQYSEYLPHGHRQTEHLLIVAFQHLYT